MFRCMFPTALLWIFTAALLTSFFAEWTRAEDNVDELLSQADKAVAAGQSKQAVELLSKAIAARADLAGAYYTRGRERFRLGQLEKSVADFDKYVALAPNAESRQWERGIAYYYVGKFKQGAAQFELYQTYHDNDVENSVWRYLCMVPTTGIEKARSVMLPIKDDRRNPMMQVFNLYRGRLMPADVLAETRRGDPPADVLAGRQFYAHLYLGLYYEVAGDAKNARKYIDLAAAPELKNSRHLNRYMWDVARIHKQKLDQARQRATQPKPGGGDGAK
mgnify:CR=1 FL=1|jgi:lipoprotein NlpI